MAITDPKIRSERDGEGGAAPARRRRGRPARLSREQVVDAVLAILEREPEQVPTLARIAREIDAVPAALYRHFENLDDLLDAVITRILEARPCELEADVPWSDQLASWMHGLRSHLLEHPAVLSMIGRSGRTSPAWLETSSVLVEILGRAGLTGRDLALTYLWVLETTVGLVMQEAALPLADQVAQASAARRDLGRTARDRFAILGDEMERLDGEAFFAFVVEQTTQAVALRARCEGGERT